jgi:hypothetical protein
VKKGIASLPERLRWNRAKQYREARTGKARNPKPLEDTNMQTQTSTETGKAPRKVAKVVKSEPTPLKAICAKLGIEPRLARRKLRNADLGFHDSRERWSFTPKQAEKVRAILKGE